MINLDVTNLKLSQLFVVLWVWHCVLIVVGVFRLLTRLIQLSSANIRSLSHVSWPMK